MAKIRHGHALAGANTSTYKTWQMMIDRCHNARSNGFHNYGGRGIRVCHRWRVAFENFLADMGERPDGLELDRIDNDGNYEPSNCRWATRSENQNNKRTCRYLTHDGVTLTVAQWARKVGCSDGALHQRLDKSGMTVAEALTIPFGDPIETRRRNNDFLKITHAGETLTAWQWAERAGISRATIAYRIQAGWTPERALTTPARILTPFPRKRKAA